MKSGQPEDNQEEKAPSPEPGSDSSGDQTNSTDPVLNADQRANKRTGAVMIVGVWVVLLAMLGWFAQQWFDHSENPNRNASSHNLGGQEVLQLKANGLGHYIAPGTINGHSVVFLLDTGATSVSVPFGLASKIGLQGEFPQKVNTANGTITVEATLLDSVSLGGLRLERVRGHINPGMQGEEVLLGMSFLRHFDLRTSNDTLTITAP